MEDLAPGIRFYPTEEELVSFYLHHKLEGKSDNLNRIMDRIIPVLDIYMFSPWQLPQFSGEYNHRDPEQWFFFIPRQESEVRGGRPKRLTTCGYWKATGSPGYVYSSDNRFIGAKRTMVFYKGRAPNGRKTEWKMNEYEAIQSHASSSSNSTHNPQLRQEFSVCRVYKKSKCVRSFDRRPVGMEIGQQRAQQVHGDHPGIRETHQDVSMAERRNSPDEMESSSSGDCGHGYHPYQTGEGSNMPMAIDDEHLFDLDLLENWYFGVEDMELNLLLPQ